MMTCYYTFGCDHPFAKFVQKVTAEDPRSLMLKTYGSNWCWEYFPNQVTENGDGTVTVHGNRSDYTFKLLDPIYSSAASIIFKENNYEH